MRYCTTKAGLHSFTQSLRVQLARTKVQVFEVTPPDAWSDRPDRCRAGWGQAIPQDARRIRRSCTACGHKPSEGSLEQNAGAITAPGSPLTSSMYRDLRKGGFMQGRARRGRSHPGRLHRARRRARSRHAFIKSRFRQSPCLSEQAPEALRGTGITIGNVSQNEAVSFCLLP
jgi:NAD(P)-dependent dehydrogenase (short-subunit alcohol dehydrogenase family)